AEVIDTSRQELPPQAGGALVQRPVQHGTPHAAARTAAETVLHVPRTVAVTDAHQIPPARDDPQPAPPRQPPGHEPFAADLVDRTVTRCGHAHRVPEPAGFDGGRQPHGPAAGDQHISVVRAHRWLACGRPGGAVRVSARFSAGIRKTRSRTALATVKPAAVSQAVWISGSASPSATTAR